MIAVTRDMTQGSPIRLLLTFSFPLLIGNLFQQFYNMADTIIVGRTLGVNALAAVGATGSIMFLVLGFAQGLAGGLAVITAQRFGAQDAAGVRRSFTTSILLSAGFTLLLTAVSLLAARPLLEGMNTPADIIDDAYRYLSVIFAGIFASLFFNLLSSVIRALGDSRTPLFFLIIASVCNMVLDIVFIVNFGMGVAGAAWATVIAQVLSGLLCLLYIFRRFAILRLHREDWVWRGRFAWEHLRIATPMAFQFCIIAVGSIVVQGVLNGFGSTTVAAFTAASKIDQLATQPLASIGVAIATFSAQNYGAGKYRRIRDGVRKSTLLSLAFSLAGAGLVIGLGHPLVRLFVGEADPTVFTQAQTYLNLVSIFYFLLGCVFVYRNTIQGMGRAMVPMVAGVFELVMRVAAALVLARFIGYAGVCLASPLAWLGSCALIIPTYLATLRRLLPQEEPSPDEGMAGEK